MSPPALSASFDCARATTWRERLICRTPALSELDGRLGQLYRRKRALLGAQGGELLQSSERSWLQYVETVCPGTVASTVEQRVESMACLQELYQERLKELAQVARRLGPFVFNRIDIFSAKPHDVSDETGHAAGFYVEHFAFPQIDNLSSAAVAAWNKANDQRNLERSLGCDSGLGDYDSDYKIGLANHRVTSMEWIETEYCHGTSHGYFNKHTQNLFWGHGLRELASSDVFADGWKPKLQRLFWEALLAKGWTPPPDNTVSIKNEVEAAVIEPGRWLFTTDGINVDFSPSEGGCYVYNPGRASVSWHDLRPLLRPGSLVP